MSADDGSVVSESSEASRGAEHAAAQLDVDILTLPDPGSGGSDDEGPTFVKPHYNEKKARIIKHYYKSLTENTAIEVRYIDDNFGKGMFAKRDIKKDEDLYSEEPIACYQNNTDEVYACQQCLRYLGLPDVETGTSHETHFCKANCHARYCSQRCRSEAWEQHHKLLCTGRAGRRTIREQAAYKFNNYTENRMAFVHWELAARMIAQIVLRWKANGNNWTDAYNSLVMFRKIPFWNADHKYKEDSGGSDSDVDTVKRKTEAAAILLRSVMMEKGLENVFTAEFVGGILGLIDLNCVGLTIDSPTEDEENAEYGKQVSGTGMFMLQPTANHSCLPNALNVTKKDDRSYRSTLATSALRDIKKGEEITISYIEEDDDYLKRLEHLKDYRFTCSCDKCQKEAAEILESSVEAEPQSPASKGKAAASVESSPDSPDRSDHVEFVKK